MTRWSLSVVAVLLALAGCRGQHQEPGEVTRTAVPANVVAARAERQAKALAILPEAERPTKQILFGDLHVHTTFSPDAFARSLPMLQGEGVHPPADACDFARFCSDLDFWSINDHAEGISTQHWAETKESIRQCNAVSGDPKNPDLVAFLGWEWTQVGLTPEDHYGHKNVIFRDTADDRVPRRPISALNDQLVGALRRQPPLWQRLQFPLRDWSNRQRYFDFGAYQTDLAAISLCPSGVDTRQLPADCHESAQTPDVLYEKLSQWGFDTIVIPHGNTWGLYTPAASSWDKQLKGAQHDPQKQTLIEVFSGHGNSEEYRPWRAVERDAQGNETCPAPSPNYEPCCWRAGELIRERCGNAAPDECERRVQAARQNYLKAGIAGRLTVPGSIVEDWKDCGLCRDCFTPAFNYVPTSSAQYALGLTNFDDPNSPRRFRFGFIASSDNHTARPGTGYKEYGRRMMTEAAGAKDEATRSRLLQDVPVPTERLPESIAFDPAHAPEGTQAFLLVDIERQASFFMTGGLVGLHSEGRDREAIWSGLKRREVFATSGERILLWFDLLNGPNGRLPMGSEVRLATPPRFRVRAAGSFKQKPGCPDSSVKALSPQRLEYLCRGECYNPSDERYQITRIEVVRIRPQTKPGEPLAIEDPWARFDCPRDPAGCAVEFGDPGFLAEGREAIYYARAIQEPTKAVNGANLRCRYNEKGECVEAKPCHGDFRTPYEDDCLAPIEERAWSSPIYVTP